MPSGPNPSDAVFRTLLAASLLTLIVASGGLPVMAQESDRSRALPSESGRSASPPSSDVPGASVPDWAEPSVPARSHELPSQSQTHAPDLPSSPSQVPVDGGLGWLAAAGAAYAIGRLRNRSRSSDLP